MVLVLVVSVTGWMIWLFWDDFDGFFEVMTRGWRSFEQDNAVFLHTGVHAYDGISHNCNNRVSDLWEKKLSSRKSAHVIEARDSLS